MIAGVISDTHHVDREAIEKVVAELKNRGAEVFVHCGDMKKRHLDPDLFSGLPVFCALIEEQVEDTAFKIPPPNWTFTLPGQRIVNIMGVRAYLGHKRAYDFLLGSEQSLINFLDQIRKDNDGLRLAFSGHTHHQIFAQTRLVNFINPGAIESFSGSYEFALVNTNSGETVFSRLLKTKPLIPTFSVGVISDSLRISLLDQHFWELLQKEFIARDVRDIIHVGNIALEDIGRPELENFQVHYNLRSDQRSKTKENPPQNWHLIDLEEPVVEINGYRFYVQLDLGATLLNLSEVQMHEACLNLRRQFHELDYLLCGFTNNALLTEEEQTCIVNPGDVVRDRNFAVVCLPRNEITFGHVPYPA